MNQQQKAEYDKLVDTLIARDEERAFTITDRIHIQVISVII